MKHSWHAPEDGEQARRITGVAAAAVLVLGSVVSQVISPFFVSMQQSGYFPARDIRLVRLLVIHMRASSITGLCGTA